MSATDSDNSIDWLASDYEDNESEQEFDSDGKCGQVGAPLSPPERPHLEPPDGSRQVKDCQSPWSQAEEASSRGSPPSCVEEWDGDSGLCKRQQSEKPPPQQALKRPRSSVGEERRERQLLPNESEKSQTFSHKCMELQCYIHPLSSILNGLRSGRYRERLSSFQESVAMDRIQRIMGVLQNPCLGEKYVNIILKMEEMLKSWFPNVKLQDQVVAAQTEDAAPPKKPKLSPGITTAEVGPVTLSEPPACSKVLRAAGLTPPGAYSASNLKWPHASAICSATVEQAQAVPRHPPPPRDKDLTQDNSVSSSTDSHSKTGSVPRGPPPGKINAPCLERLLKSTESIIGRKGPGSQTDSSWS